MRKDVKLGLAIGSVLFLVILVLVLVMSGPNKKPQNTAVAGGGGAARAGSDGGASGATVIPQNPSVNDTPLPPATGMEAQGGNSPGSSAPIPQGGSAGGTGGILAPQTPPGHSGASSAERGSGSQGAFSWSDILAHGPSSDSALRTQTPPILDRNGSSSLPHQPPGMGTHDEGTRSGTPNPPATQPAGLARSYVVKQGETFWTIAVREYGNGSYFGHLVRANPKINPPSKLRAGMTITIPAKGDVVPVSVERRQELADKTFDPTRMYRVKAGDSLYTICQKLYGKADRVDKLYQLNKVVIGPNPAALKPNMVLSLPDPITAATSVNNDLREALQ